MNKFVIIPKKTEGNIFKLLPLLYVLNENFDAPEINIVHTTDLKSQLSALPMKINYFFVEERNFGAMASLKLASKLDDLFNITHVLTYREEVGVLQFIKALRAKNRIGWKSLVNDVFLTESVANAFDNSYLSLIKNTKTFNECNTSLEGLINRSEEKLPENFFKDSRSTPFFFLSCQNFSEDLFVSSFSKQLIESLGESRLIIWSKEESELLKDLAASFQNIVDASLAEESQLFHYITRCQTFITTIEWHSHLACYLGIVPYLVNENKPYEIPELKYSPHFLQSVGEGVLILQEGESSQELNSDQFVNLVLSENEL
jgi:hypothetical protein